jgi:hypothetical protein
MVPYEGCPTAGMCKGPEAGVHTTPSRTIGLEQSMQWKGGPKRNGWSGTMQHLGHHFVGFEFDGNFWWVGTDDKHHCNGTI